MQESLSRRNVMVGGSVILAGIATRAVFAAQAEGPVGAAKSLTSEAKVVVVTGSTDGLGKAVALKLAADGARVIVHGRNRERGQAVVAAINERKRGGAAFYAADFASLAEVRAFADTLLEDYPRIDLLINNAGIGSANPDGSKDRKLSVDGFELRFAVNYLSGFLLTRRLLPRVLASAPARIVNVASLAQRPLDFDNVMLEREYDGSRAYGQSKLAQIMFTQDLALELAGKQVSAHSLHPATYMDTSMVRSAGVEPRSSVEEGARAVVHVATSPEFATTSGLFFNGKQQMRANAAAYDDKARRDLRELSLKLVQRWLE